MSCRWIHPPTSYFNGERTNLAACVVAMGTPDVVRGRVLAVETPCSPLTPIQISERTNLAACVVAGECSEGVAVTVPIKEPSGSEKFPFAFKHPNTFTPIHRSRPLPTINHSPPLHPHPSTNGNGASVHGDAPLHQDGAVTTAVGR